MFMSIFIHKCTWRYAFMYNLAFYAACCTSAHAQGCMTHSCLFCKHACMFMHEHCYRANRETAKRVQGVCGPFHVHDIICACNMLVLNYTSIYMHMHGFSYIYIYIYIYTLPYKMFFETHHKMGFCFGEKNARQTWPFFPWCLAAQPGF